MELLLGVDDIDVNAQGLKYHTALIWASSEGHIKVVEHLLGSEGINVNLGSTNMEIQRTLMWACMNGHIDILILWNYYWVLIV